MTPDEKVKAIITVVANRYGIGYLDVIKYGRTDDAVRGRYAAIRTVHRLRPKLSYVMLGEIFDRHHSTIMYALGLLKRKPTV